jgi:hypothetical protein
MPDSSYTPLTITIYTDTPTEKDEFIAWAKKHDSPLAPFLLAKLRAVMEAEQHPRKARQGPTDHDLREQIAALQSELRAAKAALARAEARTPAQEGYVSERYLAREIAGVLRGAGAMPEAVLFSELDITGDGAMQALVRRELEIFEVSGRVRKSSKGWRYLE